MFSFRGRKAKARRSGSAGRAALERLENRRLLSVSVHVAGEPALIPSTDINVSALAGDENEAEIAIDPSNPARMFATGNYGPHGSGLFAAYSSDAGATWSKTDVSDGKIAQGGSEDLPLACCNSSVAFDRFGNLFLTYLEANTGKTVLAVSGNGGRSFGNVTHFGGTNNDTDQPTVITGPGSNGAAGSVWILYANHNVNPVTHVDTQNMAAQGAAVNGVGAGNIGSFGAVQLVPNVAGVAQNFGDASVGEDGQLLVAFQDDTSADGPVMIYASLDGDGLGSGGFSNPVAVGSTNAGGEDAIPAQPNMKIDSGIGLAYDISGGADGGRVYMVYTDENINESDDTDTWVRYSDDDGSTWSAGVRVNDDVSGRSQFLPRIAVDAESGLVGVSWYDARNDPDNEAVQIYAAISDDGGESFGANVRVSDGMSVHRSGWNLDYGGYSGLAFLGGTLYPAWADNSASLNNFEIYTDRVVVAETIAISGDVAMSEVGGHFLKIVDGAMVRYASEAGAMIDLEGGVLTIDSMLELTGLSVAKSGGNYLGRVDVKDNDLIIHGASSAAAGAMLADLADMLRHGRNDGGLWMGDGIGSSVAAAQIGHDTGLNLIRNSDDGVAAIKSSFDGRLVDANDILIKYSWNGDADLDGDVDADDFARIDAGFIGRLSGYRNGDFNYSGGSPDADDYFLIDKAYGGRGQCRRRR
jgi:hypothetical protein